MNWKISKITMNLLNLNYNSADPGIWVNNSKTFRKLVGINGMLLPVFLWLFVLLDSGRVEVVESISHYYYTRGNAIFIGIMSVISMFLIVYKGKEKLDFYISLVSGIAAICVILFPTDNLLETKCLSGELNHVITYVNPSNFRAYFHYGSAAVFLLGLAVLSGFVFTRSNVPKKERGSRKILRNRIYRVCSALMFIAIGVIFFGGFLGAIPEETYENLNLTFWMEVLAVESFGISWLVKGEAIFGD